MLLFVGDKFLSQIAFGAYSLAQGAANALQVGTIPSWVSLMVQIAVTVVTVTVAVMKLGNSVALLDERMRGGFRVMRLRLRRLEQEQGIKGISKKGDEDESDDDDS